MTGRLENQIKTEQKIKRTLKSLPQIVADFYYNISTSTEPKSCYMYIMIIKGFIEFIEELNISINDIDETIVTRYLKTKEQKTNKEGQVQSTSFSYRKVVYAALNNFLFYLKKKKIIKDNPMDEIKPIRNSDNVKRIRLTANDMENIISAVDRGVGSHRAIETQRPWRSRDKAILLLFIYTGMRETALTEINLNEIDFENNTFKIIDKRHKTQEYIINNRLKEALIEWIQDRELLLEDMRSDALFISVQRSRISPRAVSDLVKKYSKAGIGTEISPHKLRSAFCTILYDETKDINFVSQAVGHKNIETTQRYIVNDGQTKKKAVSLLDDIFSR